MGIVYQHYEDDDLQLSQLTIPFTALVPLTPALGLSLRTVYASTDGDDLAAFFGMADAQAALSYYRTLGAGSAVASLAVNLPVGTAVATREEVETAYLLGLGFFDFRVPSFGQGLNVTPGLTYAFPVAPNLALGVGASYQYRGDFEPRAFAAETYDPGDEVLLTAGLDYGLGEASTLALDATYVHYGEDRFGDLAYTTGDAFLATAQWTGPVGAHEARVLGRVRLKGESSAPPETLLLLGPDATIPTQARLLGHVRFRLGERVRLGALAQGRYYDETEVSTAKTLFDLGVLPEYELTPGLVLNARLGATLGDFRGGEVGAGLTWGL
jgi:hypothetical protein